MKIEQNTTGFLDDATYFYHIKSSVEKYEADFDGLDLLKIDLVEVIPERLDKGPNSVEFSEDGKTCNITLQFYQTRKNGKVTHIPDQQEVFTKLEFVLKRAVKEFADLKKK